MADGGRDHALDAAREAIRVPLERSLRQRRGPALRAKQEEPRLLSGQADPFTPLRYSTRPSSVRRACLAVNSRASAINSSARALQ
jgi:hypothetical protein